MARQPQGRFLGIPYNWERPKGVDIRQGIWDSEDSRILTPKTYGWGYGVNLSALVRRITRR